MSKITNDGLTGCFIAVPSGNSACQRVNVLSGSMICSLDSGSSTEW